MPFQTFSEALLVTSYLLYHLLMFGGTIPDLKPFEAYFEALQVISLIIFEVVLNEYVRRHLSSFCRVLKQERS